MIKRFLSTLALSAVTLAAFSTSASAAVLATPACDPAVDICTTPLPTVSPMPTVSPTPSPAGCGDFWANPLSFGAECSKPNGSNTSLFGQGGYFQRIANALIFVVGAVSVIMIILGGLRFVVSMGNPKSAAQARDSILYAIIGVLVAFVSYAVVNFVVTTLGKAT